MESLGQFLHFSDEEEIHFKHGFPFDFLNDGRRGV